jgi:hypothetical protein
MERSAPSSDPRRVEQEQVSKEKQVSILGLTLAQRFERVQVCGVGRHQTFNFRNLRAEAAASPRHLCSFESSERGSGAGAGSSAMFIARNSSRE